MSKQQKSAEAVVEPVADAVESPAAPPVADPWAGLEYDGQDWDDVLAVLEQRQKDLYALVSVVAGENPVSGAEQLGEVALEPLATLRERVLALPGPPEGSRWVRAKDAATKRVRVNGKLRAYRPAAAMPPPQPVPPPQPQAAPAAPAQPPLSPSHVYPHQAGLWPYPAPTQPPAAPGGLDVVALVKTLAAELGLGGQQRAMPGLGEFPSWLQPILAELFRQRTAATEDAVSIGRNRYDQGFEDGKRVGLIEGRLNAMLRRPRDDDDDDASASGLVKALAPVLTQLGANLGGAKPAPPKEEPTKPREEAKPEPTTQTFDVAKVLRRALESKTHPREALALLEVIHPDAVAYLVANRAVVLQAAPAQPELSALLSTPEGIEWMQQLGDELAARAGAA